MQIADQIYYNGSIITMDSRASTVDALAVINDTILAVGNINEMMSYKGKNTVMTDLKGRTMLPGFIDSHSHFVMAGNAYAFTLDLSPYSMGDICTIEDIKKKVADKIKTLKKGEWVIGFGYHDTNLKENRHPFAHELDEVSPDNPVLLSHASFHLGVANSYVLKLANVSKDTPDPHGGIYHRFEDGSPNGVVEGVAIHALSALQPKPTEELWLKAIQKACEVYTTKGVTSAQDGAATDETYAYLKKAHEKGILKNRVQVYPIKGMKGRSMDDLSIFNTTKSGTQLTSDKKLSLGALKMLIDGGVPIYTAYLSNPYHKIIYDLPEGALWCGYPIVEYNAFAAELIEFHKQGWQLAVHANGDAAIGYILDAVEEANKSYPRADARHIVMHCQTVREDQLIRMKRLGMLPSFFIVHVYFWGDKHRDIFLGNDRAARLNPCRSAMHKNLSFTIHNDTHITPMDPLLSVWTAVNRLTSSGKVLGAEQCVPVIDALRAITSHAAYQAFEEKIKGSLEPDKLADMVILNENPLEVAPLKIKDIKILTTIVGNEIVYGAYPNK